jgi:phospho-N-acetylmuramoyl-pentapeptide-transferase
MRWMFFMPVAIALVVSLILGPIVIPLLRKMKFGQTEREDGVQSHLKKAGTPTMGGIIILGGIVFASLFYVKDYPRILPILFVTLGFGFIGFLDDYLKVVKKHPDGLLPKQKMALQLIVTAAFAFYLVKYSQVALTMLVPFSGGYQLNVGWLAIPILFIATIGTVNGTNFTDGLDGLATSVTVVVAIFFRLAAMDMQSGIEPIIGATIGALAGFLFFNSHPASVFMGDTGSLALGGFVVSVAYMLQMPLFILIIGLIYVIEVASVALQVLYFKKTGGKRLFKMAPIHHHFELSGWSEVKVVAVFTIITIFCGVIGLLAM